MSRRPLALCRQLLLFLYRPLLLVPGGRQQTAVKPLRIPSQAAHDAVRKDRQLLSKDIPFAIPVACSSSPSTGGPRGALQPGPQGKLREFYLYEVIYLFGISKWCKSLHDMNWLYSFMASGVESFVCGCNVRRLEFASDVVTVR